MESIKLRHDMKRALHNTKSVISKTFYEESTAYIDSDADLKKVVKDKTNLALRRNMKIAQAKQAFRRLTDPCINNGPDWYTFADQNCYNQLDEVVVTAKRIKKTKKQSELDKYISNIDFWDGSIKDPWPDSKWDWFEDRQGGDQVWGSLGGNDTGRKLGKNGKMYNSYQGDDLVPWGGGAKLKFWAHKLDYLSFLQLGLKDGGKATRHGHNLYNLYNGLEVENDTMTIKIEEHYPYFKKYRGNTIPMINKRIYDTIINKSDYKKVLQSMTSKNQKKLEEKRKQFNVKYKE